MVGRYSLCAALVVVAGCRDGGSGAPDAFVADAVDAPPDAVDKAAGCASTFGNELTNAFGRVDGTILAVVPPGLQTCALPNGTHLVLQVTMNGAAYRMVINIQSDVLTRELDAPLPAPAWAEGWHTDAPLDYVTTLGAHSGDFARPVSVVDEVTDQLELGARVSVYATSGGGTNAGNAHLVHRNLTNADGAIVLHPDGAPHFVLFRFDNQTF